MNRPCNTTSADDPHALPRPEGAHAPAIRRMLADAAPFRPEASSEELVAEFANGQNRMAAFLALYRRGPEALPAVRQGFQHANPHVRRWSAILADNWADGETFRALTALLDDPQAGVRVWAVHALACERCKDGPNPVDAVPLLLERIEQDSSIRVRRHAVAMLAHHRPPDSRVVPMLRKILSHETDAKLRLHAMHGLERYRTAGPSA